MNSKQIIKVSDLLDQSNNLQSFSETVSFIRPDFLDNDSKLINEYKTKKVENILKNKEKELEETSIFKLIKKLEESNTFGQIFISKKNGINENEEINDCLFIDLPIEYNTIRIISQNNEATSVTQYNRARDENIKILDLSSKELLKFLFDSKFNNDADMEYKKYLLGDNQQNEKYTQFIEQGNQKTAQKAIIKDEIYIFLKNMGVKNKDSFYLDKVGFIYQKNDIWNFIEHPDIHCNVNDFDNFLKIIIAASKLNNIHLYNHKEIQEKLDKAANILKNKYSEHLENLELYKENSKPEEEFDILPSIFSFANKYDDIKQAYLELIEDTDLYDYGIIPHDEYYFESENYDQDYAELMLIQEENNSLLLELHELHEQINKQNVETEASINDQLLYINTQLEEAKEDKYDQMMYELYDRVDYLSYNEEMYDTMTPKTIIKNENSMWLKLDNLTKENGYTIEDFFQVTQYRPFSVHPKIRWHDEINMFPEKRYDFTSKQNNMTISFAVKDDMWYLYQKNIQGDGLASFVQHLYKQVGHELEDVQATHFIKYIESNKEFLDGEKDKRMLKKQIAQKTITPFMNMENGYIQYIEQTIGLEAFLTKFIHDKKNYFLFNIDNIESRIRGSTSEPRNEFEIGNEHYRFKDNKWVSIETKKQNEGFLPFIHHICQYDSDKIQHMLNNVNLYIKNVVLLNEQLYTTPKLANYQEPKNTESNSALESKETNSPIQNKIVETNNNNQNNIDNTQSHETSSLIEHTQTEQIDYVPIDNIEMEKYSYVDDSYIPAEMYEENVFESNSTNENNEPVIEKTKTEEIQNIINPINDDEILTAFQDKVNNRFQALLLKNSAIYHFSVDTFIDICERNQKPYFLKKVDGELFLGKNYNHKLDLTKIESPVNIVEQVVSIYPQFSVEKEITRINELLEPELFERLKIRELEKLAAHENELLKDKIIELKHQNPLLTQTEPNCVETKHQENKSTAELSNKHQEQGFVINESDSTVVTQNKVESESPQEQYDRMLGLDYKLWNQPLKNTLNEYSIPFNNRKVTVPLNQVLKEYLRLIKREDWEVDKFNIVKNTYSFDIINCGSSHIKSISVQQSPLFEKEEYTIYFKNNEQKQGESLTELMKVMFGNQLNIVKLHQAIGNVKEINFLNLYPMEDIITNLGGKKKSANYEFNNLTININETMIENAQMFKIWQNREWGVKSVEFARMLLLNMNTGILPTKELIKEEQYKEYCSFVEGKNLIKSFYLNLNNIQKISFMHNNQKVELDKIKTDKEKFDLLLPSPSKDSKLMFDYLVNKRKLNPKYVEELNGAKIYAGEYDAKQTSWYNQLYNQNNEVIFYPVVVFASNDKFAAVRGITEDSDFIKQNVPGSNNSEPFYVEPSEDYSYKDSNNNEHYHVAVFEAAIDALSYRCLHPQTHVFSLSGTNVNFLIDAMIESEHLVKNNVDMKFLYALDNLSKDEDGKVIDKASRAAYFKVLEHMGNHCYNSFIDNIDGIQDVQNDSLIQKINQYIVDNKDFDESQKEQLINCINNIEQKINKNEILTYNNKELQHDLGNMLFDIRFVQTGRFELALPQNQKYGQHKDWNEFLVHIVKQKEKEYPNLTLEEIHENIIEEFNPNMIKTELKKELNKIKPQRR
jgi:hypothetical protein